MDDLNQSVAEMIAQLTTLSADAVQPSMRLREDLGLDSVASMELLSMIAEEYDIDIDTDEAMQINTVAGVVEMIARRRK